MMNYRKLKVLEHFVKGGFALVVISGKLRY